MASHQRFVTVNNYRVKFVESPPDSFYCSICLQILREPRIAECCGKTSCLSCVQPILTGKETCPFCKAAPLNVSLNRNIKNRIAESKVRCPGEEGGCQMIEKFEVIAKHIEACQFIKIECPHSCGANFARSHLELHLQTCKRFPIVCKCGKEVERSSKNEHSRVCPLTKLKCPFNIVGCSVEVLNRDLTKHFESALTSHLDMVAKRGRHVNDVVKQVKQSMLSNTAKRMAIVDSEIVELLKDITASEEKAKSLSKLLTELEGEILYAEAEGKTSKGAFEADIAAKEMRANGLTQRASNLQLGLKVKKLGPSVPRYPAYPVLPRPTQPMGSTVFIAPITFQIPNFTERVANDELWLSPPFYTHRGGYKFCLKVFCNGDNQGHSKWLSIYAQMIKGENDDKLHWPFSGKLTIKIPNKLKNTHHQVKTIAFDRTTDSNCEARKRIVNGYFAEDYLGYWNFMTKSVLFPSSLTVFPEFRYVVDDRLEVSIANVSVY